MDLPVSILSAGIMSLLGGFLMYFAVNRVIWARYKEKQQKATFYLYCAIWGLIITTWSASVVYFTAGFAPFVAFFFQKCIYGFIFIATICMFFFAREIFFTVKKQWVWVYAAIGIACIAVLASLNLSDIMYVEPEHYPVYILKTEFGFVLVAYIVPTLLGIFLAARRASKRIDDVLYQVGYSYIAWGQILFLFTMVVDTIASVVIDQQVTYGVTLVMEWILLLFGVWFYYMGWILPESLRKRIEARQQILSVKS